MEAMEALENGHNRDWGPFDVGSGGCWGPCLSRQPCDNELVSGQKYCRPCFDELLVPIDGPTYVREATITELAAVWRPPQKGEHKGSPFCEARGQYGKVYKNEKRVTVDGNRVWQLQDPVAAFVSRSPCDPAATQELIGKRRHWFYPPAGAATHLRLTTATREGTRHVLPSRPAAVPEAGP